MATAHAETRWHYFRPDPAAGGDIRGRRYCCCGVVEGNARHPYAPRTATGPDWARRAAGDRDEADTP